MKSNRIKTAVFIAVLLAALSGIWLLRSRKSGNHPAPSASQASPLQNKQRQTRHSAAKPTKNARTERLPVALIKPLKHKPEDIPFPLTTPGPPYYNSSTLAIPGYSVVGGGHANKQIIRSKNKTGKHGENDVVWHSPDGWNASWFSTNPDATIVWVRTYKPGKQQVHSDLFLKPPEFTPVHQADFEAMVPGMDLAGRSWLDPHRIVLLYGRKWKKGELHPHWEDGAAKEADPYAETVLKFYDVRAGRFLEISPESAEIPRRIESVTGFGKYLRIDDKDDTTSNAPYYELGWYRIEWK